MKSRDLRTAVKNKYENGDGPTKIYGDADGIVPSRIMKSWIQMINRTEFIVLSHFPGRPRTTRTKTNILKVKRRLAEKERMLSRLSAGKMHISATSARRILREDLGCFPYKKIIQPKLTDLQNRKKIKFANWVLNNYTKKDTRKWLFTDEKYFDLDGVYNVHNDCIWAVSREEAGKKRGIYQKTKLLVKVMSWLDAKC